MKITLTLILLLIFYQFDNYSQKEGIFKDYNQEKADSIRFLKHSHYDSESKDLLLEQFNKNRFKAFSSIEINNQKPLNNGSEDYTKITLGREEISGWTIFSDTYNIWQIPLDLKPRVLLGDGNGLIETFDLFFDFWVDSSWYWENNILYLKNDDGNPDSIYNSVIVVNSGGWGITAGNFNGDNFSDIVYSDFFRTFVHYGGPKFSPKADKVLETEGFYLANAGDVNGDGYDELISSLNWGNDSVYIYPGSPSGLDDADRIVLSSPNGYNSFGFGHSVSKDAGDINGDGFNDLLIGAPGYFSIYLGNSVGINIEPDNIWVYPDSVPPGIAFNLSFMGDINFDGFDDIASSYSKSLLSDTIAIVEVFVFYGSASGLNTDYEIFNFEVNPDFIYRTADIGKPGDINGDGVDDLLIGNQWYDSGRGQAYIFFGSENGLANFPDQIIDNPLNIQNSGFGSDLDGIGDFNNDGFNDIIIGSPYDGNNAYIFYGSGSGVSISPDITLSENDFFGWSVSKAGDVLGDGKNYIIVGEEFGESYLITLVDSINLPPNWQVRIYISNADNSASRFITLGQNEIATDEIDFLLGEDVLPQPLSESFDARFILPDSVNSIRDIRNIEENVVSWIVKIQPGPAGYPITFSWNNTILPEGSFNFRDVVTGTLINVDMKSQDSYTLVNPEISLLQIEYRKMKCTDIYVESGWNIISVPTEVPDMISTSLFPTAVSTALSYNNGYLSNDTLEIGKGYWLKFSNSENIQLCGFPDYKNIGLIQGWNIIGPFDTDVPVVQIGTLPVEIITSDFYEYSDGYKAVSTLQKGKGYWINVSENGELLFENNSFQIAKKTITKTVEPEIVISVYVSDGNDKDTLEIGVDPTATDSIDIILGEALLPPIPPVGAFDTRLNIPNTLVSSLKDFRFGPEANEFERVYRIQYQKGKGAVIKLEWDLPSGLLLRVQDIVTGNIIYNTYESGRDSITIFDPDVINKLDLTVTYPLIYIPVELLSFNGLIQNNAVILKWETASETNNKGFEIERNLTGQWEKAGYIDGSGTTTRPKDYSFTDYFKYESFKGEIKYRLKQIDFDGTYSFSDEIKLDVDFIPKEFILYQNFPNPFNPVTTIKYAIPFESSIEIIVYNPIGQKIKELYGGIKEAGFHDIVWQPENLSSGIYFYSITAKSSDGKSKYVKTQKMIMMK